MLSLTSSFILVLLWHQATAQRLDTALCIGDLTTAAACNSYQDILVACDTLRGKQAADCYCPQTVLNQIAGCKNEFRICRAGTQFDSQFDGPNGFFGLWHSACDDVITYVPTTPAVTSLSGTVGLPACQTAQSNCAEFGAMTDSCWSRSKNNQQDCLCQRTVLDLASRCEIDGSVSCMLKQPTSTNLYSYKQCRKATGSITDSQSVVSTPVASFSQISISISTPQPTASPTSPTISPTSSSISSSTRNLRFSWQILATICLAGSLIELS